MDEQTELLRQILEQLRGAGLPGGSTVDEARQALEDFSDKIKLANLSADQLKARSEKLIRDQAVRERELQNAIKAKLITEKEAAAELKKYIEEQKHIQQILESLGEVYEINIEQLSAYHDTIKDVIRTEEERKKAIQQSKEKLGKFDENIKALTDHALKPLFNATTGVLKGLQSGASGVRVAGDAALGLASAATGAGSALGEQAQNFGLSIAATTRGPLRLFGLGLTGIGTALGLTSKAAGAVAEAALPYLTNELEKTQKLFETANNAGALFANGMTGMRVAAHGAGLTIDQFDEVLKSQSKNFALMGVGVSDATKRLGGITQSLQSSGLQRQLMNLGYGFREQAELVGETIELMRLAQGGAAKIPNDVVAKETAKYAENLRLISAITGEDAKAKMQQAKEAANNMAFQQKLASMSAEQQIQIQAAMNSMTQLERKNFMDMMLFGTVINTDGAKSLALFPALQEKLNEQVNLANQGLLDGKTNIDLNAKYANTLKEQYLSSTAAAQAAFAGADSVAGVMQHALEGLDQSLKFTTESVNNAGKAVQEQKNTQDDLTNRMRELSENTQK
ncbi:MAG: hypothetical protein N2235_22845, partial [Fischerella sp.]|nr:hypothetical protein [Fischerella sp.]